MTPGRVETGTVAFGRQVETGTVAFGSDWTGVFLRGDDAFHYASHLRRLLERGVIDLPVDLSRVVVESLCALLESSREPAPGVQTYPSPFCESCGEPRGRGLCSGHCDNDE